MSLAAEPPAPWQPPVRGSLSRQCSTCQGCGFTPPFCINPGLVLVMDLFSRSWVTHVQLLGMLETIFINCCTPSNADPHFLSHHQITALYSKNQMKSLLRGSQARQTLRTAISTSTSPVLDTPEDLTSWLSWGRHVCTTPCRAMFNNKCDLRFLLEHTKEKT